MIYPEGFDTLELPWARISFLNRHSNQHSLTNIQHLIYYWLVGWQGWLGLIEIYWLKLTHLILLILSLDYFWFIWLIDWLIDCLIVWLIDWLIDCLIDRPTDRPTGLTTERPNDKNKNIYIKLHNNIPLNFTRFFLMGQVMFMIVYLVLEVRNWSHHLKVIFHSIFHSCRKRGQPRKLYPNFRKVFPGNFRSIWF